MEKNLSDNLLVRSFYFLGLLYTKMIFFFLCGHGSPPSGESELNELNSENFSLFCYNLLQSFGACLKDFLMVRKKLVF